MFPPGWNGAGRSIPQGSIQRVEFHVRELAVTEPEGQKPEVPSRLLFHWIKSRFFRVVHADGAFGGISPRGYLHFAFYNERAAIPRLSERDITKGAGDSFVAGPERVTEGREGSVREVEVEIMMDHRTAREFLEWLRGQLEFLDKTQQEKLSQ
jgi:hypothetical protein